ncbi:MAG: biopolymer transporter ExbD [Prevotellaceae bacterium]|jgi:biopolymer transport protein ExbD|nr:biopolymer transporter ExbD [Prevotellaceae bacterium]
MGKVKPKKHSTIIDMTAMSDVTVLLLTFFMSTATFLSKEPVQVMAPGSVMEIKIPDAYITTILIRPDGKTYLNFDRPNDKLALLAKIGADYNIPFTEKQKVSFLNQGFIGVPFQQLTNFLDAPMEKQDAFLKTNGLATDSTDNQLKQWLQYAIAVAIDNQIDYQKNYSIAVKADRSTAYPEVQKVITTLQDLRLNRFNLITTLEGMPNILASN